MTNREMLAELNDRWDGRHDQHYPAHYTMWERDLARSREKAEIEWALSTLTPERQCVIRSAGGLGCFERSRAEIANLLNIKPRRVTSILSCGLADLSHPLRLGHFLQK